jgi:hypothetical protein
MEAVITPLDVLHSTKKTLRSNFQQSMVVLHERLMEFNTKSSSNANRTASLETGSLSRL